MILKILILAFNWKTITLPVVLYSCETWSLTLREEVGQGYLKTGSRGEYLGPGRIANSEWRRLYNEELHSLYRSSNIVRVIKSRRFRWAGHVARLEEGRSVFKILTGTPAGNWPLGRSRRRWEDNIGMDLKKVDINTRISIDSAQDKVYWTALGIEPPGSISCGVN